MPPLGHIFNFQNGSEKYVKKQIKKTDANAANLHGNFNEKGSARAIASCVHSCCCFLCVRFLP